MGIAFVSDGSTWTASGSITDPAADLSIDSPTAAEIAAYTECVYTNHGGFEWPTTSVGCFTATVDSWAAGDADLFAWAFLDTTADARYAYGATAISYWAIGGIDANNASANVKTEVSFVEGAAFLAAGAATVAAMAALF